MIISTPTILSPVGHAGVTYGGGTKVLKQLVLNHMILTILLT